MVGRRTAGGPSCREHAKERARHRERGEGIGLQWTITRSGFSESLRIHM
jgi:hypothetical protein